MSDPLPSRSTADTELSNTGSALGWTLRAPFGSFRARLSAVWNRHVRRWPYEICMACGGRVGHAFGGLSWWRASDDLWLTVVGDPHTVRCPACFTREAKTKGIFIRWEAQYDGCETDG